AIMVNCNPETVSTDYDTSDRLYFEPLTLEDVLNIVEKERPLGVVVQFGGQTPLKLAVPLREAGVPILGTSPDAIDRAEDRQRFNTLIRELGLNQAAGATARSLTEAQAIAASTGYPVLVRPSYVLGGRAMLGHSLEAYTAFEGRELGHIAVKESVFPFVKFPGVDAVLGPEMKSTGEVMGLDRDFRKAYLKSQIAAGSALPTTGKVFISVKTGDRRPVTTLARRLVDLGFSLVATPGTARVLERYGM